jgi:hypothetical protein
LPVYSMIQKQYLRTFKFYSRKSKNDMQFELKQLPWFSFNWNEIWNVSSTLDNIYAFDITSEIFLCVEGLKIPLTHRATSQS